MEEADVQQARMRQMARLWSRAQPAVAAMVAGAVVDYHDAEDLVAEVAETVVTKFGEYDPSRPFLPWALGIARILILRHYERRAGERRHRFDERTLYLLARAHDETADEIPARLAALRSCIQTIRGKSRQVLDMRYVHGLKPDAIAEALGMTRNAVWVMLHRVRVALTDCVRRRLVLVAEEEP
jgi:RNA polymerase sigma-70 factor (ECF subfamily)